MHPRFEPASLTAPSTQSDTASREAPSPPQEFCSICDDGRYPTFPSNFIELPEIQATCGDIYEFLSIMPPEECRQLKKEFGPDVVGYDIAEYCGCYEDGVNYPTSYPSYFNMNDDGIPFTRAPFILPPEKEEIEQEQDQQQSNNNHNNNNHNNNDQHSLFP